MEPETTIRMPLVGRTSVLDPQLGWTTLEPGDRFLMEVVTRSGRAASVEFRIGSDYVQIWHRQSCHASFDRVALRNWLAFPREEFAVGEVAFTIDRMVDRSGRVALTLPDVRAWTLSPEALAGLHQRL